MPLINNQSIIISYLVPGSFPPHSPVDPGSLHVCESGFYRETIFTCDGLRARSRFLSCCFAFDRRTLAPTPSPLRSIFIAGQNAGWGRFFEGVRVRILRADS